MPFDPPDLSREIPGSKSQDSVAVDIEIDRMRKDMKAMRDWIGNFNGRLEIVTSNPDGSRKGTAGDIVLLNNSGTFYLEVNTDGGTTWRGVLLSDTP